MINVAWEQTLTENVNLQITNALGQTIKKIELGALQSGSQLIQISTEDINNGIYSIQLVSDKNVHSTMVKISK
jgi:outer membrane biogenesis lipoprotein LolB